MSNLHCHYESLKGEKERDCLKAAKITQLQLDQNNADCLFDR